MFEEAIKYIGTPEGLTAAVAGIIAIVGLFVADGWIPGFTELTPRVKRVISLAGCLALPVAGAALGSLAPGYRASVGWVKYADAIALGLGVFFATQVTHARYLPNTREIPKE